MGVIVEDNLLIQKRLLDPYASYDSLLTSELMASVYKNGDSIVSGLEVTITNNKVVSVSPGLALKGFTSLHINDTATLDITAVNPISIPDAAYLVVVQYVYQLVKPPPVATIKLITLDAYDPQMHVICKIVFIQGTNFINTDDIYLTYERQNAEFKLNNPELNDNNSNYPRESITLSTFPNQPRLILVDRADPHKYYEVKVDIPTLTISTHLLDLNNPVDQFRSGDIFLHDSKAGTIAHDIHDGIFPKRIYAENGVLITEMQNRLRTDDLQFIGQFDTVGFTNGGPVYNLYAGSQVLVDRYFVQNLSFIAIDSILMVRNSNNTIVKVSINVMTSEVVFTTIPDPVVYIQGFAFYVDNNGMYLRENNTLKLVKIDGVNPANINYTSISQDDLCGFPSLSRIVIKASNNQYYELYYDAVDDEVKAIGLGLSVPTNPVILNNLPNNLNWNNPLATLTVVNVNRLFAMDGRHTLEFRNIPDSKAVKFASNGTNVITNITTEGFDGVGGPQAYNIENSALMIEDSADPTDRYRYTYNFDTHVMDVVIENFLKTNNDQLLTPAKNWIFRIKRRLFHQISNNAGTTVYTPVNAKAVLGNTIPFILHPDVTVNTFAGMINQWLTNGGLLFRRLSDEQRFRVSFNIVPLVIPQPIPEIVPVFPAKPFDVDVAVDRDLIFYDNVTRKYYAIEEDTGAIEISEAHYGVYNDNIWSNYMEYANSGTIIIWGMVAAQLKTLSYVVPETITFPPSTIFITDPFYDDPGFGKLGFAGDCVGQKFVIDITSIGLDGELLRDSDAEANLTTVLNFGLNDIYSVPATGLLIFKDNVTGDYYYACAVLGELEFTLITPMTVIPAQSVVIEGRTTYWNNTGANVDNWRWEYSLENGVLVINVFDVYQDHTLLAYPHVNDLTFPSIIDTPGPNPYINLNVIGTGRSELKYDHNLNQLHIDPFVLVGGPNSESFPAYIIEDEITGIGYYIYGKNLDNAIHLEPLSTVSPPARHVLIYRNGIVIPTVIAAPNIYVLTLRDGVLEVDAYANVGLVPPPVKTKYDILRPFNLPLTVNPIKTNLVPLNDRYYLPLTVTAPNLLAFPTQIVGTKARLSVNTNKVSYTISTTLDANFPGDTWDIDGMILRDIHDGRFYKVYYDTVTSKFKVDQVTYVLNSPKIFYEGIMQIETVSQEYCWIQLNDGFITVRPGSDFNL